MNQSVGFFLDPSESWGIVTRLDKGVRKEHSMALPPPPKPSVQRLGEHVQLDMEQRLLRVGIIARSICEGSICEWSIYKSDRFIGTRPWVFRFL